MRKPRQLTPDELAQFQWQMPLLRAGKWGVGPITPAATDTAPDSATTATSTSLHAPMLDWRELFGNSNPVEVEVGMGKGLFLLNTALAHPETNYLGIEIVRKYQLYATTRFAVRDLRNVKTVCADAGWIFRQFVPVGSVATVHVYFPDPWWKARHKKRRVFTPGFAADAAKVLREGGLLRIATDVEEYFGVMTGIVRAMPAFCERQAEKSTATVEEAGYETNFERKARQKGTPVWRAEFERTTESITEVNDPAAQ